jgi:SAM-dependent methyltransferase
MEKEYLRVNRRAYNLLAEEYRKRGPADRNKDLALLQPFVTYLAGRFGLNCRVLDIGPGNGINLGMFRAVGFQVVGVDISQEMLKVARENCPEADLYCDDFLAVPLPVSSFQGIFAKAVLHLFPKVDALTAFRKVFHMLVDDGMFYVTTTVAAVSAEGYFRKDDYPDRPLRFRRFWTPEELLGAVGNAGFSVYQVGQNVESDRDKHWYSVWAIKPPTASFRKREGEQ